MHTDEVRTDRELVERLVGSQFPELATEGIAKVEPWGTANAIWRVGEHHVARLPRIASAVRQVLDEARWLPWIAPQLPVAVPEPVAVGRPGWGYPFEWSLHRWLPGEPAELGDVNCARDFAGTLAGVVRSLQQMPTEGAPAARNRARPLGDYHDDTRNAIESAKGLIDTAAALAIWQEGLESPPHDGPEVWVHGDLEGNLLLSDGSLSGLVDWGSACAGDPAVDVQVVWSPLFDLESRKLFLEQVGAGPAVLARSRAAAVHQACAALPYYLHTYPLMVRRCVYKLLELGVEVRPDLVLTASLCG